MLSTLSITHEIYGSSWKGNSPVKDFPIEADELPLDSEPKPISGRFLDISKEDLDAIRFARERRIYLGAKRYEFDHLKNDGSFTISPNRL